MADDWGGERAERVGALGALLDLDAREHVRVLPDVGDDAPGDVDGDGAKALIALGAVLQAAADGLRGHADEVGEQLDLDLVVEDVRARRHGEARAVADYLAPVAVQDAAARGLRVDRARAV